MTYSDCLNSLFYPFCHFEGLYLMNIARLRRATGHVSWFAYLLIAYQTKAPMITPKTAAMTALMINLVKRRGRGTGSGIITCGV